MTMNPQTHVSDIAAHSPGAVRVFERYGIDYCCGGKRPLEEACVQKGLDVAEIERELAAAENSSTQPPVDWSQAPLRQLADHIVEHHHEYLRQELPALSARLEKVHRIYNQRYGETLPGLPETFASLRQELETHMKKEERVLFPAIAAFEHAQQNRTLPRPFSFGSVANPIQQMEAEHTEAGGALEQIRKITADYTAPDHACITYRALMDGLRDLEQDLHLHIHLENNILFPRAIELERHCRQQEVTAPA